MIPEETEVISTYIVQPPNTNINGTAFGGQIMAWMDEVAAIAALRFCKGPCVTVNVDEITFNKPIALGDIVVMKARVNYTGKTSLEIGVKVYKQTVGSDELEHALSGYLVFVAIGEDGKPREVPEIAISTKADTKAFLAGEQRQTQRRRNRNK